MLAWQEAREIWGNRSSVVCVVCILAPSGKLTRMPFVVASLSVQGVLAPRKWIVQPESTMALVWGAVTRELKVKLFITMFL